MVTSPCFLIVLLLSLFTLSLDHDQTDFTDTAIDGELTATEVCDLSSDLLMSSRLIFDVIHYRLSEKILRMTKNMF